LRMLGLADARPLITCKRGASRMPQKNALDLGNDQPPDVLLKGVLHAHSWN
jgi:hypothetical protein